MKEITNNSYVENDLLKIGLGPLPFLNGLNLKRLATPVCFEAKRKLLDSAMKPAVPAGTTLIRAHLEQNHLTLFVRTWDWLMSLCQSLGPWLDLFCHFDLLYTKESFVFGLQEPRKSQGRHLLWSFLSNRILKDVSPCCQLHLLLNVSQSLAGALRLRR